MADIAIQDLPAAGAVSSSDLIIIDDGTTTRKATVSQLPVGSAITVQEEGASLTTSATTLNFVGAGVTATGVGATKTITIPGAGAANTSLTAAGLETARSAGTLSAFTLYAASDTGALYWASTTSTLDPVGGTVYLEENATESVATAALTPLGTGDEFDVRGYSTFSISIYNGHTTSFSAFDVAIKNGSGAWEVTHSAAADFAVGDDFLIDCTTDATTTDVTTLPTLKTAFLRFDVRGVSKMRIRAQQATSDSVACTWYSIKEA